MPRLSKEEREELKEFAKSSAFKSDLRKILQNRHNPFIVEGRIDLDRFIKFLSEYNRFINHTPKPFRKIIDRKNKL